MSAPGLISNIDPLDSVFYRRGERPGDGIYPIKLARHNFSGLRTCVPHLQSRASDLLLRSGSLPLDLISLRSRHAFIGLNSHCAQKLPAWITINHTNPLTKILRILSIARKVLQTSSWIMGSHSLVNGYHETPSIIHNDASRAWIVQKFGGTSVGKFADCIAENVVRYAQTLGRRAAHRD